VYRLRCDGAPDRWPHPPLHDVSTGLLGEAWRGVRAPPVRPSRLALSAVCADAYAVQHPGQLGPQAMQSVGGHLVSLFAQLELGLPLARASAILDRGIQQKGYFTWLTPPSFDGADTVLFMASNLHDAPWAARVGRQRLEGVGRASHPGSRVVQRPLEVSRYALGLTAMPCRKRPSVEAVLLHANVELVARQTERLRRLRLVEACSVQRLLDHRPLHRFQIARRRRL
jgi:Family of unknown function (DUF5946)